MEECGWWQDLGVFCCFVHTSTPQAPHFPSTFYLHAHHFGPGLRSRFGFSTYLGKQTFQHLPAAFRSAGQGRGGAGCPLRGPSEPRADGLCPQVDHAKVLHYIGAGVAFPTSMLFVFLQSVLTYRMAKTRGHYWTGHLRSILTAVAFITLVFSILFLALPSVGRSLGWAGDGGPGLAAITLGVLGWAAGA